MLYVPRYPPLAYPAGRAPGFDPTHLASAGGVAISVIAANSVNFIDLLNGTSGTVTVGNQTFTSSMNGFLGPCVTQSATASGTGITTFRGGIVGTPTSFTLAAFFSLSSVSNFSGLIGTTTSTTVRGNALFCQTTNLRLLTLNGTTNSTLTIAANIPYFAAVSEAGAIANFVLVNLSNGNMQTASVSNFNSNGTGNGTITIGNIYNNNSPIDGFNGSISAAMYSYAGLSVSSLLQWAQRPWDFWYPRTGVAT